MKCLCSTFMSNIYSNMSKRIWPSKNPPNTWINLKDIKYTHVEHKSIFNTHSNPNKVQCELPCEWDIENPRPIAFLSLIQYLELYVPKDGSENNKHVTNNAIPSNQKIKISKPLKKHHICYIFHHNVLHKGHSLRKWLKTQQLNFVIMIKSIK